LLASLAGKNLLQPDNSARLLPQREKTGICLGYNTDPSALLFFSSFFSSTQEELSHWVNPAAFLNFSNNVPASLLSMQHQCLGPIFTVSTGATAGLDALNLAATVIQGGHTDAMLAGAVQEITPEFLESFAALPGEKDAGILRSSAAGGVIAGEGCALLALEKLPVAEQARGRAWVWGYGEAVDFESSDHSASGTLLRAIHLALADARLQPAEVEAVFLSASGNSVLDKAEAGALRELFGRRCPPDTALKGTWGECYHAGGAMAVAAAVLCLEQNFLPPTLNLAPGCDAASLGLSPKIQTVHARKVLIISLDVTKKAAALVIGLPRKD